MKLAGAKKQTLFLTGVNAVVRALGLVLRVVLSRTLGAEVTGISELAQSIHMIAITPLTSGLPVAISRLTALADKEHKYLPVQAGLKLVRLTSLFMIPALWLLSPLLASVVGDLRVLPSLWITAPCVLILGYSASLNGFCYGLQQSHLPAISEFIEQLARLIITLLLFRLLSGLTAPWMAAVPVAATFLAEILGLFYVVAFLPKKIFQRADQPQWRKPILGLAVPTTLSRIVQTLLRSFTAILIPLRLQKSGLPVSEATAQLGMLNGMVMPFLMLPCVFTSALSMVALPRLAVAEKKPKEFRRLIFLCAGSGVPVSALCAGFLFSLAPFLANVLFRMPELTALFRLSCPMTVLFALSHLSNGILSALGQQKKSLFISFAVSAVMLFLTWLWAAKPALRLHGVIFAQAAGQTLNIVLNILAFGCWYRKRASQIL